MEYKCIDAYKDVENVDEWEICPKCGLKPKVWIFDNGRSTACGCGKSIYDHFSISAESIMSLVKRNNGDCSGYNTDELRYNWNHWCKTGEVMFEHSQYRNDGKW